jgi:O-antigen biosynthesis protein
MTSLYRTLLDVVSKSGGWSKSFRTLMYRIKIDGLSKTAGTVSSRLERESILVNDQPAGSVTPIQKRYQLLAADAQGRFSSESYSHSIEDEILYSFIIPVYKVDIRYLDAAIESIKSQTYTNWEICIVDDGSCDDKIDKYLEYLKDSIGEKLKYISSRDNKGISHASNQALGLASGEYLCLMDNDDIISRDAVEEIHKVAKSGEYDLIYSDECKVDENGLITEVYLKPDWDPVLLQNMMYFGHLSAYKSAVVRSLGGFRSEYDFSQDYDLALRFSETSDKVWHIPKILYGWRAIPESAAAGGKPHARATNIAALQDAMSRRGWSGQAVALPTANQVVLKRDSLKGRFSIIIPSDDKENIENCIKSIITQTSYAPYQIIIVTNSSIISQLSIKYDQKQVQFVVFDATFNFSKKCNVGAQAAKDTDYYIFYNDDVTVKSRDWLERFLDVFADSSIAAVGPKLLYDNGTIQHAGMVTGVRGLLGTAFHCMPANTSFHYNYAQSVRQVSILSGACLAVRSAEFIEVHGFDDKDFPIAHSDADLCFRLRNIGKKCVYTPHAVLIHEGHKSIGQSEFAWTNKATKRDKSDAALLEKWSDFVAHDPFFNSSMASQLYHDSQEFFKISAGQNLINGKPGKARVLIVTHDLSESGAPRIALTMAVAYARLGYFVTVVSPTDGPIGKELISEGISLVVDELLFLQHESVRSFACSFDVAIANTAVSWPFVHLCAPHMPVIWYIHETQLFVDIIKLNVEANLALGSAAKLWVGSHYAKKYVDQSGRMSSVQQYGIEDHAKGSKAKSSRIGAAKGKQPIKIGVFGSYEPRKGQDLAIYAADLAAKTTGATISLTLAGRILDAGYYDAIKNIGHIAENVFKNESTFDQYFSLLQEMDIVLISSRSDTLPLVSLHALQARKILVCSSEVGTSHYIEDGVSGYIAASPSPEHLSESLSRAIAAINDHSHHDIAEKGRKVFDNEFGQEAYAKHLESGIVDLIDRVDA